MTDDVHATSFSEVFHTELEAIHVRRGKPLSPPVDPPSQNEKQIRLLLENILNADEGRFKAEEDLIPLLRKKALDANLTALAFSGGGIRSATFCLGFLQGLAHFGLLKWFDYLSTVSGGGYIGSWFAAWVKREGSIENVEKQLMPNRIDQAQATRPRVLAGMAFDDEPEPLRHLRAYSNYLAPRPGLFSADGWTLISLYLRNLLLNQLVLFFALLAFLFVVFWLVHVCAVFTYVPSIPYMPLDEAGEEVYIRPETLPLLSWWFLVPATIGTVAFLTGCVSLALRLYRVQLASVSTPEGEAEAFVRRRRYLLLGLAGFVCLAATWVLFTYRAEGADGPRDSFALAGLKAASLALVAWVAIWAWTRSAAGRSDDSARTGIRRLYQTILATMVLASFAACLTTFYVLAPLEVAFYKGWCFGVMIVFGAINALFHLGSFGSSSGARIPRFFGRSLAGFLSGSFGGFLMYALLIALHAAIDPEDSRFRLFYIPYVLTLGPPALLAGLVLTGFLQVGLLGGALNEAQREWRSSVGGRLLICAALWLVVVGTVVFGPFLLLWSLDDGLWARAGMLAAGWGGTVLSGLIAARSPATGGGRAADWTSRAKEVAARIAPPVFLLGMLTLSALAAVWLLHFPFMENEPQPFDSGTYLRLLNSANGPWYVRDVWNVPVEYAWLATTGLYLAGILVLGIVACLLGWRVGVNLFSLNGLYANRLIRCYLGASRLKQAESPAARRGPPPNSHPPERNAEPVSGFDPGDDMALSSLRVGASHSAPAPPLGAGGSRPYPGPVLLVNTALNLAHGAELALQDRKAEPFVLTPYSCGCPTTGYRPTADYAGGLTLGSSVSISGAAVSPNMGYHSAPAVTALLTVFNARLGAWLGNPGQDRWRNPGPPTGLLYLLNEMLGRTDAHSKYLYLSDGGHFDNTGVYELIRRRCRFIVVCDAGADGDFALDDLGGLIRKVLIDFGIRIEIDLTGMRPGVERRANRHVAVGKIRYGDVDGAERSKPHEDAADDFDPAKHEGLLVYVKPCLTGDEAPDLLNYATLHPEFPHEPTVNQFFSESQFESYRALGFHSAKMALGDVFASLGLGPPPQEDSGKLFEALYDQWVPPPPDFTRAYLESNQGYLAVQDALRTDPELRRLRAQLYPDQKGNDAYLQGWQETPEVRNAERHMAARMLRVLETAWFDLNLEGYRDHPVNNGWMAIFRCWTRAQAVRDCWPGLRAEFSKVFQRAIDDELK